MFFHVGLSENLVYPEKPNGFADHYPYEKWLAIIGNINPTFSDNPIYNLSYRNYIFPLIMWMKAGYSGLNHVFPMVFFLLVKPCIFSHEMHEPWLDQAEKTKRMIEVGPWDPPRRCEKWVPQRYIYAWWCQPYLTIKKQGITLLVISK